MIGRQMEDDIRRIVREEIAGDEMRRIAGERSPALGDETPGAAPGGLRPPPGAIFLAARSEAAR